MRRAMAAVAACIASPDCLRVTSIRSTLRSELPLLLMPALTMYLRLQAISAAATAGAEVPSGRRTQRRSRLVTLALRLPRAHFSGSCLSLRYI